MWDTAAGQCVLTSAGGSVQLLDGSKRRTKTRKRFTINAKTQTTTNGIEVNIGFS
ncbi:inositol monophosphatase family protein [Photobacterium damselae subsp. piscicida]|nr:inositol monophosphatase family protein [Photobacterium damselae subsp. piscicida]